MLALVLLLATGGAVGTEFRLPHTVTPLHYTIKLIPFFEELHFTYHGEVAITVNATTNTSNITLHQDKLILPRTPSVISLDGLHSPRVVRTSHDNVTDFYTLHLSEALHQGCLYQINILFIGRLWNNTLGFYHCYYTKNDEKRWFALSYFEPALARRAFPCFDEPALKARFTIKIARPANYISVSNMPLESTSYDPRIPDRVWDTFQESPPMSTYLVGFMVSDFKNLTSADGRYTIWGQENVMDRANYTLAVTASIVEALENYTGVNYSLPKLDAIADLCFRGGMENWGMVVYQEWEILESKYVSVFKEHNTLDIVVHEVAHMWFGNLVTPAWWDDLWLKEGLARYFEFEIIQQLRPDWNKKDEFVVVVLQYVLHQDIRHTHPIIMDIENPAKSTVHTSVVYGKGACVIRMMEHFLTQKIFKSGLRRYVKKYAFNVASADNLFEVMEEEKKASGVMSDNIDVKTVMDSWTLQESYPLLTVVRQGNRIFIFQEEVRKVIYEWKKRSPLWWVPVSYTTSDELDFSNTQPRAWLQGVPHIELQENFTDSQWVLLNLQVTGVYRVNYDLRSWQQITDFLKSSQFHRIHPLNRAELLDDVFFLANTSLLNVTTALEMSTYLVQETHPNPWTTFFTIISNLNEFLIETDIYDSFRSYVLRLMKKLYDNVGPEEHESDSHSIRMLRFNLLYWACYLGYEDCIHWASVHYTAWLHNPITTNLSLDLKSIVFCTAMSFSRDVDYDEMWNVFAAHNMSTEFLYTLAYLQCTDKYTDFSSRYENMTISLSEIKISDIDFTAMSVRSGLTSNYMRIFNKRLNHTNFVSTSSFSGSHGTAVADDDPASNTILGSSDTNEDITAPHPIYTDIRNWLRQFETRQPIL